MTLYRLNTLQHEPTSGKTIRQSLLNDSQTCLAKVRYKVARAVPWFGSVSSAIGTGYHGALAHLYASRQMGEVDPSVDDLIITGLDTFDEELANCKEGTEESTFSWVFQTKTARRREIRMNRAEAHAMIAALVRRYIDEGHDWPLADFEVIAVEQGFSLPLHSAGSEWARTGTTDLVLRRRADGLFIIVDHKTSKSKWKPNKHHASQSPQAAFYIRAWKDILGPTVPIDFYYDVMPLDGKPFERRHARRSPVQLQIVSDTAVDLARLIDQNGPYPPSPDSFLCAEAWCDFWAICPSGAQLHEGE